jgi:hypothetical protein
MKLLRITGRCLITGLLYQLVRGRCIIPYREAGDSGCGHRLRIQAIEARKTACFGAAIPLRHRGVKLGSFRYVRGECHDPSTSRQPASSLR